MTQNQKADRESSFRPAHGAQKLFNYIGGKNEAGDKIAMTAPVRVLVHPSEGPFCESNFTVSFYVPFKFQVSVSLQRNMPSAAL